MLTLVPIWAVMGLSWNLISGYSGLVSFGHAVVLRHRRLYRDAALVYWHLTPWLGIPLGMLVGAVAAALIGMPTFRLRGHYFALSMLAYPLAILYVLHISASRKSRCRCTGSVRRCHAVRDPRLYTLVALGCWWSRCSSRCWSRIPASAWR